MAERVQVDPSEIKVGDLIEVETPYSSGDSVTHRGVVTQTSSFAVETEDFFFTLGAESYTFYRLPKPAPEEPKGLGAVVEDTDGDLWVRRTDGRWYYGEGNSGMTWAALVEDFESQLTVKSDGYTA